MDKNRIKIRTIELDEITRFDEENQIEYWFFHYSCDFDISKVLKILQIFAI